MINNENKVYGLLGLSMKAGKLTFGTDSCLEMISKKSKVNNTMSDSSERTINNFKNKCKENNIPVYIWGNRDDISKSIGKNNKTVLGIKDKNLADAIKKILDGGDVIG